VVNTHYYKYIQSILTEHNMSFIDISTVIFSVAAVGISILAYVQSRPSKQLKLDQMSSMQILATNTIMCYHLRVGVHQTLPQQVHSSNLPLMRTKTRHLIDSIDKCIGLGLWDTIVSNASTLILFSGTLESASQCIDPDTPHWKIMDFTFGIFRMVSICNDYNDYMGITGKLSDELREISIKLRKTNGIPLCFNYNRNMVQPVSSIFPHPTPQVVQV